MLARYTQTARVMASDTLRGRLLFGPSRMFVSILMLEEQLSFLRYASSIVDIILHLSSFKSGHSNRMCVVSCTASPHSHTIDT